MDTALIDQFNKRWDNFIATFRGRLMKLSDNQILTYANAKLALNEIKLSWVSEYDLDGKWLEKVTTEDANKGRLVKKILTDDMNISETNKSTSLNPIIKYSTPLVGGLVGFGAAKLFGVTNTLALAGATLAPVAILYPAMEGYSKSYSRNALEDVITEYVSQLDKYKISIISVLES